MIVGFYKLLPSAGKEAISPAMDPTKGRPFSYFCSHFLYDQFLTARERGKETSLSDFPADILIDILNLAASSSRSTVASLALTSTWVSDVTLEGRWKHTSVYWHLDTESLREMAKVCSDTRISHAVRTLWFDPGAYYYWKCSCICDILERFPNLEALACEGVMLEALCCATKIPPKASVRLTLIDQMDSRWDGIVQNPSAHGKTFLRTITHLHLTQKPESLDTFPVEHLPNLTHLAMGFSQGGYYPPAEIGNFALCLDRSLCLKAAVLVLPSLSKCMSCTPQEAVEMVRKYSTNSKIMFYCADPRCRESQFWDKLARDGDDIWSVAERQMDEKNWEHHPLLQGPATSGP
ncbi:hypothetical protein C8F04DRAFT_1387086 [Mycena alexandri]|uniref:Uncharacterized protein n=1 Tax=Mycena alexandri TaxID=1745969 RepID=A0AAD6TPH5_9AGAR|nr:hypothetical protein C8F04DRAFT_1387086 [Mycena alexandri]